MIAIGMIVVGIAISGLGIAIEGNRIDASYRTTLLELRRARQGAIDGRRVHVITFTEPRTIKIERIEEDDTLTEISQVNLANGVEFRVEEGVPTESADTPDRFGTAEIAIDFNGGNQIYFQPDGSAVDEAGAINNGVIYLARTGKLDSSRAVTLYGATGRVKGWRLREASGAWEWQ